MKTTPHTTSRLKDIALFLFHYGGSDLITIFKDEIDLAEIPKKPGQPLSAKNLVADLQALGPTFIKAGQLLNARSMLPLDYAQELDHLQDQAEPFPFDEAQEVFVEEFTIPIRSAFASFNPIPIATASLGQVYRAILPSNLEVAVKIQRPNVVPLIRQDLDLLGRFVNLLENHTEFGKRYRIKALYEDLKFTLLNELDYEKEATNLESLKENLKEFNELLIPAPIRTHSRKRVLTMEYIDASKITNLSREIILEKQGDQLIQGLVSAYLKQILIDGFYHMDPHPGNIYLTRYNQLAIFDLGMVGRVPPVMRGTLLQLFLSLSEGRGEDTVDLLLKIGKPLKEFNYFHFKEQASDLVAEYYSLRLADLPIGRLILSLANIAAANGLLLPFSVYNIGKMMVSLDRVAVALAPNLRTDQVIQENAEKLLQTKIQRELSTPVIYRFLMQSGELLRELPSRIGGLLEWLSRNEMHLKVQLEDEESLLSGIQKVANRIAAGLIAAGCLIGGALVYQKEGSNLLANGLIIFGLLIGIFLFLHHFLGDKLGRK